MSEGGVALRGRLPRFDALSLGLMVSSWFGFEVLERAASDDLFYQIGQWVVSGLGVSDNLFDNATVGGG